MPVAGKIFGGTGVRFDWFVDRELVRSRVDKKVLSVLSQVGAFGRNKMRSSILPQKASKKHRTVDVEGKLFLVPISGRVIDVATGRDARKSEADAARAALRGRLKSEGVGKPPRRGPSNLLRRFILFGVDPQSESVVIGAMPFASQPRLVGAVSVPELLDQGGGEYIGGELVRYDPRPFVQPAFDKTLNKFKNLIQSVSL